MGVAGWDYKSDVMTLNSSAKNSPQGPVITCLLFLKQVPHRVNLAWRSKDVVSTVLELIYYSYKSRSLG
ncbi:hypothetical protein WISP_59405 [Willisornis vidua]|uniref:Uncharacterized protein n=1 Tax=Willisornis vidua TaxID=1566151 RepID=A0ABQ9DFJ5_9PASS|nr:hypothetical protein WISP_59405 [Willisornis vidua]